MAASGATLLSWCSAWNVQAGTTPSSRELASAVQAHQPVHRHQPVAAISRPPSLQRHTHCPGLCCMRSLLVTGGAVDDVSEMCRN